MAHSFRPLLFAILLTAACAATDVSQAPRRIPFRHLDDPAANAALLKQLVLYDQKYFAREVPGYVKPNPVGVAYTFHDEDDGGISLELFPFGLGDRAQSKLNALEPGFRAFLPKLADAHLAHRALFEELAPAGADFIRNFSVETSQDMCGDELPAADDDMTPEQWDALVDLYVRVNGTPLSVTLDAAQYYRDYGLFSEQVSLFYKVDYDRSGEKLVRVDMIPCGEGWGPRSVLGHARYQSMD